MIFVRWDRAGPICPNRDHWETMEKADPNGREAFLRALALFDRVDGPTVRQVAQGSHLIRLSRGDRLFCEGDESDTFYLMVTGWMKILRETASGRSVLFELLGPGDMVGAVAVLDQRPLPATAVAAGESELLSLPGKLFRSILHRCPAIQANYSREIGQRMREARDWQSQLASNIEGRIAQLFLRLAERMGEREGERVRLPRLLTRSEIANMVGTTVETAIRTLSRWHKAALVVTEEDSFLIHDVKGLVALTNRG